MQMAGRVELHRANRVFPSPFVPSNGGDINRIVKSRPTLPSSAARIVRIMLNPSLRSQCRRVTPQNESLLETTRPFTAWLRYAAPIHGDHSRKYGKKNPQLGEPRIRLVATFSAEVRCRGKHRAYLHAKCIW